MSFHVLLLSVGGLSWRVSQAWNPVQEGRHSHPPRVFLDFMGETAGVHMASLGVYLHRTKKRARWAEGFHNELNGHMFDL